MFILTHITYQLRLWSTSSCHWDPGKRGSLYECKYFEQIIQSTGLPYCSGVGRGLEQKRGTYSAPLLRIPALLNTSYTLSVGWSFTSRPSTFQALLLRCPQPQVVHSLSPWSLAQRVCGKEASPGIPGHTCPGYAPLWKFPSHQLLHLLFWLRALLRCHRPAPHHSLWLVPVSGAHKPFSASKQPSSGNRHPQPSVCPLSVKKLIQTSNWCLCSWCVCLSPMQRVSLMEWIEVEHHRRRCGGETVLIFSKLDPAVLSIRLYWNFKDSRRAWRWMTYTDPTSWAFTPPAGGHTAAQCQALSWPQGDEEVSLLPLVLCFLLQERPPAGWVTARPSIEGTLHPHSLKVPLTLCSWQ